MKKSEEIFSGNMKFAMNMVFIFGPVVAFIAAFFNYLAGLPIHSAVTLARGVVGLGFWIYASKTKQYRFGYVSQIVVLWLGVVGLVIIDGGINSSSIIFFVMFGPILFLSGVRKEGWILSSATAVMLVVVWWTHSIGFYVVEALSPNRRLAVTELSMAILMAICIAISKVIDSTLEHADKEHELFKIEAVKKNKFFIHINHELRNPLAAVLSAVYLLRRLDNETKSTGKDTLSQKDNVLKSLQSTCDHLLMVVNEVLDFERLSTKSMNSISKEYVEFDPRLVVSNSINILSAKAVEKSLNISCKVEVGVSKTYIGSPNKIQQVLLNLISNSLQHSGSDVTVYIRHRDEYLVFDVSDSGKGISEEDQAKLFEPFSSGLGFRGTSGLGLSICKMIVTDLMHGSIAVTSEVNKGTTFTVRLPLKSGQAQYETLELSRDDEHSMSLSSESLKGMKILYVEDDRVNNELTSLLLSGCGMIVCSAYTSTDALDLLRSNGPFDIAIVDNDLGSSSPLNGVGLSKELISNGLKNIIGFTGNYSTELESAWGDVGVSEIILKPASIEKILQAISALNKSGGNPSLAKG